MEGQDVVQLLRDAIQRQGVSEGQGDGELPLAGLGLTSVGYACFWKVLPSFSMHSLYIF